MGRGRHPSSLASFGPDRSDHPHVYRWPVSHHLAHKTRALDRYDPEFREQAEDLFERVTDRVGEKRAVRLTGSYSIRAYFSGRHDAAQAREDHHPGGFPSGHLRRRGRRLRPDQGRTTGWAAGSIASHGPGSTSSRRSESSRCCSTGFDWAAGTTWTILRPRSPRWCWNSRLNRVGGGLAPPVLPHYPTYGSVSGGSPKCCSSRYLPARLASPCSLNH